MRDALLAAACALIVVAVYGFLLLMLEPRGGVVLMNEWADSEVWRHGP